MAFLKNWTDNLFQIFFMGTSWVAVSINNITTRASREMTSRKNINIFYFNGVNVAKHWHVAGEVFAISDCLVTIAVPCQKMDQYCTSKCHGMHMTIWNGIVLSLFRIIKMNVTASTRSLSENNITAFSDNETETTATPAIEEWWLLWQYVHGWKIELYAFPVVLVLGWICNGMAIAVLQTQAYRGLVKYQWP